MTGIILSAEGVIRMWTNHTNSQEKKNQALNSTKDNSATRQEARAEKRV
jgi:hypothetical protein